MTRTFRPDLPANDPRVSQSLEMCGQLRLRRRIAGSDRTETWSVPSDWRFRVPLWELANVPEAEFMAVILRQRKERDTLHREWLQHESESGHDASSTSGSSIWAVSAGHPTLGKRR